MHSTQFTRLAQAADNNGWEIVAMFEMPASQGSYPSARVICERFVGVQSDYVVTMGVLPDEDDREAFFTWSTYDLTRQRAQQVFDDLCAMDLRIHS